MSRFGELLGGGAAPAPAPEPVVESTPEPIVEEVVVEADSVESPLSQQSNEFFAKLQQLGAVISALKTEYKTLEGVMCGTSLPY